MAARFSGKSDQDIDVEVSTLEFWEDACAWLVVMGVFVEITPEFMELTLHQARQVIPSIAGGALVGIGVAGEIRLGNLAKKRRDILSDRNKRQIAELNLQAEQERTKRLQIERSISQRGFTSAQISSLNAHIARFAGDPSHIFIVSNLNEPEAIRFAVSVNTALLEAKLKSVLIGLSVPQPAHFLLEGMVITSTPDEHCQALSRALWDGMRAAGVHAHWGTFDGNSVWMSRPEWFEIREAVVIIVLRQPVPMLPA
jgi:hypothetical protein